MKKVLTVILALAAFAVQAPAQDIITKKNGDEIKAKVTEVGTTEVKYKLFVNANGPTYVLSKSEIFMIKYENGDKDIFQETTSKPAAEVKETARPTAGTAATRSATTGQTQRTIRPSTTATRVATTQQAAVQAESKPGVLTWPDRRGYVGITIGPAIPVGNITDVEFGTGVMFAFNCGVLFSENTGIVASMFGTNHPNSYSDVSVGLSGLLVGPLFSFPLTPEGKTEFDLRPTIGFAQASVYDEDDTYNINQTRFAFGLGTSFRFNLSRRFSLSANLDYTRATFDQKRLSVNGEGADLSSICITVGANYRF
jgi:hypothetical protein